MLVSGIQQSGLVIYIYIYTYPFFFRFFSFISYCILEYCVEFPVLYTSPCWLSSFVLFCFVFSTARFSFQTYRLFKAMFSLLVALVTQSCLTVCDPMDYSPPASSVQGILQARILEWVAVSYSKNLLNPEIEPRSPTLQADSLPSEPPGAKVFTINFYN